MSLLEGIGPKRQSYFYSLLLGFFLCYPYLSDSTLRTSIFAQFSLIVGLLEGIIGLKRQPHLYSVVLELFLSYSYLFDSILRTSIFAQLLLRSILVDLFISDMC